MKIYIACLASYNNGTLHGKWIDASSDVEEMEEEVAKIMLSSPYPNVTVECPDCDGTGLVWDGDTSADYKCMTCKGTGQVPSAEEWAIHDFDGLPSSLGEYCGLQAVADVVEFYDTCQDQYGIDADDAASICDNWQGDATQALSALEDGFCGIHDRFRDYADEAADEQMPEGAPDFLKNYFDYDAYARDLEMDMTVINLLSGVAVFHA
jgi:antirestriction protein